MAISFLAANGVQASSAALLASAVKQGTLVYDSTADKLKICDGTSWIEVGSGSGGATPAGSDGSIQFKSGTSLAADAVNLHWDDTNDKLGIGTATPFARLSVNSGASPYTIQAVGTTQASFMLSGTYGQIYNGAGDLLITNAGANPIIYRLSGSTETMRIAANGNVGIANTAPASPLHIGSTVAHQLRFMTDGSGMQGFYQAETNPRFALYSDYFGGGRALLGFTRAGAGTMAAAGAGIGVPAATTRELTFYTSNGTALTERMIIDGSGNVGLGTATPQSRLQVMGGIQIGDDAAACPGASDVKVGTLRFNAGNLQLCTTGGWGLIGSGGGSGGNTMVSGWPDAIRCNNDTNTHSLTFVLTYSYPGGLTGYRFIQTPAGTDYLITFNSSGVYQSGSSSLTGYSADCGRNLSALIADNKTFNFVGGATASADGITGQIQFNESGNLKADAGLHWDNTNKRLGIGTATPTSMLHVTGGNIRNSGFAAPGLVVVPTTGSSYVFGANTAISGAGIYDNTATTWRLVVKDTTGNIGIGLNNPKARLDIYGVGSGATPATSGTDDATMNLRVSRGTVGVDTGMLDSGVGYIQVRNIANLATTYGLSLQPTGGNVGIGTTSPQSLLQVAGGIQLGDDAAACPGASNIKLGTLKYASNVLSICNTGGWATLTSGGGTLSGGTSGYLGVWSDATSMGLSGTSAGQQLFWDGATNRLLLGSVTAYQTDGSITPRMQVHGTTATASSLSLTSWLNGASNPGSLILGHSKSATIGTNALVDDGDALGGIYFNGDGGAGFRRAAYIQVNVDAAPGTNDMPGRLVFATSADGSATPAERMRIGSTGNVGIGTASAGAKLTIAPGGAAATVVAGRSIAYGSLVTPISGRSAYTVQGTNSYLTTDSNAAFGFVHPWDAADATAGYKVFRITTGTESGASDTAATTMTDRYYVRKDGGAYFGSNVGIGTTAPDVPLEFAATTGEKIRLWDGGAGSRIGIGLNSANFQFFTGTGVNNFSFNTGGDLQAAGTNELMRIQANGNVGIGTTAPTSGKLQVVIAPGNGTEGTSIALGTNDWGGGSAANIQFRQDMDQTNNAVAAIAAVTETGNLSGQLQFRTSASFGTSDLTSSNTRMTIQGNGTVGIGTTSPTAKLHIDGDILLAATLPRLASTSYLTLQSGAGQAMTFNTDGASERMRIDAAGNVGIGTASPTRKLTTEFPGTQLRLAYDTNNWRDFAVTSANSFNILSSHTSGNPANTVQMSLDTGFAGSAYSLLGQAYATNAAAPTTLVGVEGRGYQAGTGAITSSISVRAAPYVFGASASGPIANLIGIDIPSVVYAGGATSVITNSYGLKISSRGQGVNRYGIYQEGDQNYFGGDVGIGTTSPGSKLHVSGGDVRLDNNRYLVWVDTGGTGRNVFGLNSSGTLIVSNNNTNTGGPITFNTQASAGESVRITAAGNVGIGTTTPASQLHVSSAASNQVTLETTAAAQMASIKLKSPTRTYTMVSGGASSSSPNAWALYDDTAAAQRLSVDSSGNFTAWVNAYKPGGGAWNASSDARLKDIDGDYVQGLDSIVRLNPVRFHYKQDNARKEPSDRSFVGLIAQDVQKAFPEAVSEGSDGYLSLDTTPINFAVINAIKELKADNDNLRAALKAANDNDAAQDAALNELRREIKALKADLSRHPIGETSSGTAPARDGDVAIQQEFAAAQQQDTVAALELFIARNPGHWLVPRARARIESLHGARAVEIEELGYLGHSESTALEWDIRVSWGGVGGERLAPEEQAKLMTALSTFEGVRSAQSFRWGKEGERSLIAQVANHEALTVLVQNLLSAVPRAIVIVKQPVSYIEGVECTIVRKGDALRRCALLKDGH